MLPGSAVVVTGFEPGSPARAAGIRTGDLITEVQSRPVAAPIDVQLAVDALRAGDTIELGVQRGSPPVHRRASVWGRARPGPAMSFRDPLVLLGLVAVPAVIALHRRRRRGDAAAMAAFSSAALLASVAPRRPGWRVHVPVAALAAATGAARRRRRPSPAGGVGGAARRRGDARR